MGHLNYNGHDFDFDDRLLAHLKIAISQKLKRDEPFFLNWDRSTSEGSGRMSLWVSSDSSLVFRFSGGKSPEINPVWVRVLEDSANSIKGMQLFTEEQAEKIARAQR
ncbi:hypothetical protein GCM10009847_06730 [Leucobacter tardus]|uniref:DUF7882 domain-containing protein n=1 Tax=Leucobacter tardus TaxID=501483 RepID=A0A939QBT2_9MICO|nr:hypothetical protein [Leucobacter tardus]MBO2988876.1 hypothetical protein [Leucobacter tardus]